MQAKTLIIVVFKDGREKRINSEWDVDTLIRATVGSEHSEAWMMKDVDGSCLIINRAEFSTIKLIPKEA